jgi:excisionase family DNA binding protein
MSTIPNDLLQLDEVAAILRCTTNMVYRLIKQGLPLTKLSRARSGFRIRRSDLAQWLEERRRESMESQALRTLNKQKEPQPA